MATNLIETLATLCREHGSGAVLEALRDAADCAANGVDDGTPHNAWVDVADREEAEQ